MKSKILLTSFQTWLDHQQSNSSDDLLASVQKQNFSFVSLYFLRHLPVDIELASYQALSKIKRLQPDAIICCGMAESREKLTVESNATSCQGERLDTPVDLAELIKLLIVTDISDDAGKFVCEGLYYQLLKYTQLSKRNIPCIFIHVPLLNKSNFNLIQRDFYFIIKFMDKISKTSNNNWIG